MHKSKYEPASEPLHISVKYLLVVGDEGGELVAVPIPTLSHTQTHTHTHSLSLSLTHTHTHIYIYIYIYIIKSGVPSRSWR